MKILRTCPRCNERLYHYYQSADNKASCANCGHTWKVRLKADEKDGLTDPCIGSLKSNVDPGEWRTSPARRAGRGITPSPEGQVRALDAERYLNSEAAYYGGNDGQLDGIPFAHVAHVCRVMRDRIAALTPAPQPEGQDASDPRAEILPWEAHTPGDLIDGRVNIICPGADVVILADIEADVAALVVSEHNAALRALTPAPQTEVDPNLPWRMAFENVARMAEQGILSMDGGLAAAEIRSLAPDRTPPAPDAAQEQCAKNAHCSANQLDMGDGRILTSGTPIPEPIRAPGAAQPSRLEDRTVLSIAEGSTTLLDTEIMQMMAQEIADHRRAAQTAAQPAAWTGSGSLLALADGREGFMWPAKADAHPIPLFAHPLQPSETVAEALRELVAACEAYPVNIARADRALDNAHAALRALKGGSNG